MKLKDRVISFYTVNSHDIEKSKNLATFWCVYCVFTLVNIITRNLLWPNNNYLKIIVDTIGALAMILLYTNCCQKNSKQDIWPKRKLSIKSFLCILSFLICRNLVSLSIIKLIYEIKGVENAVIPGTVEHMGTDIVTIVRVVITGPIIEELIFRGAGLSLFKKEDNKIEAILFTSILFGICHANFAQAINATLGGFIYGYVAIQFGLPCAILFHVLSNGLVYIRYLIDITWLINVVAIGILALYVLNARTTFKELKLNLNSQTKFSGKRVLLYFCDATILLMCITSMLYIIKSIV